MGPNSSFYVAEKSMASVRSSFGERQREKDRSYAICWQREPLNVALRDYRRLT